jgi:hypothetical protein
MLAERLRVDPGRAFERLRESARSQNRKLSELATAFIDGSAELPARRD